MLSLSWSSVELILVSVGIIVIILLTVGGNLVVLFAFYTDPHLLTPSNHFLLSMAIADLLVGLIAMPFHSYGQLRGSWPFGEIFCKIWLTIDDVATMASVLSIVAITIERYWSINHSVHYRRFTTKGRIRIFSLLVWLIPLLNFAPGIWILQPREDENRPTNITQSDSTECIGAYHSHTLYLIIAQINFFAWPLTVVIVLNALIVLNLYRRSHRFPASGHHSEPPNNNRANPGTVNETKIEELPDDGVNNNERTPCVTQETKREALERIDSECMDGNHSENIPPPIAEVDEPMIENDNIESHPSQAIGLASTPDTNSKPSSSENIYKHLKRAFASPSRRRQSSFRHSESSRSTQPSGDRSRRGRHNRSSIFAWRNSSVFLQSTINNVNTPAVTGEQRNVRRLRRDKRAATSLLTLVLFFMIFLLPYVMVVVGGHIFPWKFLTDTNGQVYSAAFWLLWLNSTVNPILYPFIQPKFRDAYKKIFLRFTRRRLVSLVIDIQRDK